MTATSFASKQTSRDQQLITDRDDRMDYRSFMKAQFHLSEDDITWGGACESLWRQANGFAATFGSAAAHRAATPMKHRFDPRDAGIGFAVMVDDLNDDNTNGHIVGKWSDADKIEDIICASNDVADGGTGFDFGNVTTINLGWFPKNWGDQIWFATDWCGDDQIVGSHVPQTGRENIETQIRNAITRCRQTLEWLERAKRDNPDREHPKIEQTLREEVAYQNRQINRLKRLLP